MKTDSERITPETWASVVSATYAALHPRLSACAIDGIPNRDRLRQILVPLLEADPLAQNRIKVIPETKADRETALRHAEGRLTAVVGLSETYVIQHAVTDTLGE